MRDYVLVHVNGVPHRIHGEDAFQTLSRFLRYEQRATGTKIVCEEGDCGACTVLIGRVENGRLHYRAVNSCIQSVFQADCTNVVTVEGLARGGPLTPLQDSMVRSHGAQCGYCTPGFVMAMAAMFEENAQPAESDVRAALTGNLCRCTGYDPIVKTARAVESQPRIEELYPSKPIVDAIGEVARIPVRIANFARPVDLPSAIAFRSEQPKAVIVQGATDVGVWKTKRGFVPEAILSLDGIADLGEITVNDRTLVVGGRVTLAAFEKAAVELVPQLGPIMERFGSPQIKNAGTLAGNIANASPIADTLPFLFISDARLELTGSSGVRQVRIADFYLGYKKLDLRSDEIITRIFIPVPEPADTLRLYKVSKRSHLDISSFTAAMLMRTSATRITSMRIAFGGVAPVVLRLPKTEQFLTGREVTADTFAAAGEIARGEIAPISDVRGSREFRLQLATNILSKFYYDCVTPASGPQQFAEARG